MMLDESIGKVVVKIEEIKVLCCVEVIPKFQLGGWGIFVDGGPSENN